MGAPTFNWTGTATHMGDRIYYSSFNFSNIKYSLGDYVYLLPEEEGSALYIAKIRRAFENTTVDDAQKLCIEVQWLERRNSMPDPFQTRMHDRELVESDLSDTNLVGCIDRKALVVLASSYEEALELIAPEQQDGDWHFCSGMYETATGTFKPFPVTHEGLVPIHSLAATTNGTGPSHDSGVTQYIRHGGSSKENGDEDELLHANKRRRGVSDALFGFTQQPMVDGYGPSTSDGLDDSPALLLAGTAVNPQALVEMLQRVQASGGPMPIATLSFPEPLHEEEPAAAAAAAATAAPSGPPPLPPAPRHGRKSTAPQNGAGSQSLGAARRVGVPGRVCAECGATHTPQWREGPQGPKTLCNACGVRYHRQNKAKANKRAAVSDARPPPGKAPAPAAKKRAGPTGSRQSARQAQRAAVGPRRGQLMDSDGDSGGSPFKSAGRGRRPRAEAFGRDEEGGWDDGYVEQEEEEVVQGMRKRGSLQRMQTSEAADVLQTFKLGGHAGMSNGARSSSPFDGSDGQLLSEPGLHSDLLPLLHVEGGAHGSPATAGEGQSQQRTSSPLIRSVLRGRVGADTSGRGQDSPAPLILAATAPLDALGALKHGVSAFKRGALVHPSLNLHLQGPAVAAAGPSSSHLDAARRLKGSSVLSALPGHLLGQGQGNHPMQVTAASGDSWHTSDSTEEVAYEPLRAAAAAATAAATNAGVGGEGRALRLGALEDWAPELVGYGQLFDAIPQLLTSLPEEHAAQLMAAKQNVDSAAREAKAADAAVQAVSQVLAVKRQAAEHARSCADERVASLRSLMLSLSKQHGVPGVDLSSNTAKSGPATAAAMVAGSGQHRGPFDGPKLEPGVAAAGEVAAAVAAAMANQQARKAQQQRQQQQQQQSVEMLLQEDAQRQQQQQQRQQQEADLLMEEAASGAAQLLADSGPTEMDMEAVIGADWQCLASGADVTGLMPTSNGHSSLSALHGANEGLAMQQQQQQQQQPGKQQRAQEDSSFLQGVSELLGMSQQQQSGVGAGPETTPVAA